MLSALAFDWLWLGLCGCLLSRSATAHRQHLIATSYGPPTRHSFRLSLPSSSLTLLLSTKQQSMLLISNLFMVICAQIKGQKIETLTTFDIPAVRNVLCSLFLFFLCVFKVRILLAYSNVILCNFQQFSLVIWPTLETSLVAVSNDSVLIKNCLHFGLKALTERAYCILRVYIENGADDVAMFSFLSAVIKDTLGVEDSKFNIFICICSLAIFLGNWISGWTNLI